VDPAQSRLLLENEWQRTLKKRRPRATSPADGDSQLSINSNRLNNVAWAMAPLDFERALSMVEEASALNTREWSDIDARHHLLVWLLASEEERRILNFERPRSEVME
jgi:hypothetical protein